MPIESPAALPAGTRMCPGWTTEFGSISTFECGGTSGHRRRGDPALIRDTSRCCARCNRQKQKWDEEHGAKAAREKRDRDDYEGLIAAYAADALPALTAGSELVAAVQAVDGLTVRGTHPPFARRGEEGYQDRWGEPTVPTGDKLNVLRRLAGFAIEHRRPF